MASSRWEVRCLCGGIFGGFTFSGTYYHSRCCSCRAVIPNAGLAEVLKLAEPRHLLVDDTWLKQNGMKMVKIQGGGMGEYLPSDHKVN